MFLYSPGLAAGGPGVPWITVSPSGGWRKAASTPIEPPAPGRFSTTTGWPSLSLRILASSRELLSVMPPGVNGTTKLIGRVGQVCPAASAGAKAATTHSPASAFLQNLSMQVSRWLFAISTTYRNVFLYFVENQ